MVRRHGSPSSPTSPGPTPTSAARSSRPSADSSPGRSCPSPPELEHEDRFPAGIVDQMRDLGLFGVTIPEALRRPRARPADLHRRHRGAGLRLDEPHRHRQHAHDVRPRSIMHHGSDEQKAALAAVDGDRRAARGPVPVRARRRQRHPQHLVQGPARRRRVRAQRHQGLGHQRRAGRASSPWPPAPRRASRPSSSRRSPGPTYEGISVSKHVGKLGYKGVETVEMAYADHRVPAANLVGEAGRGLAQILGALELGRVNVAARAVGVARAAFEGVYHLRPATRSSLGRPSPSSRPSSSSWRTWPPGFTHPASSSARPRR